jgi:hypothetical protein
LLPRQCLAQRRGLIPDLHPYDRGWRLGYGWGPPLQRRPRWGRVGRRRRRRGNGEGGGVAA